MPSEADASDSIGLLARKIDANLTLSNEVPTTSAHTSSCTIVCDAHYGLPTQKRPRKERVNAMARQLRNFESWYCESASSERQEHASAVPRRRKCLRVALVGSEGDVDEVGGRLGRIRDEEGSGGGCRNSKGDGDDGWRVELMPDLTVEGMCSASTESESDQSRARSDCLGSADVADINIDATGKSATRGIVYLSPDAPQTLNATALPPRTVVVGMLIDRRVQPQRSLHRAEKLASASGAHSDVITPARLPMDELRVEGLGSDEALNVDTVLELMVRWWEEVDESERKAGRRLGAEEDGERLRQCFVRAAMGAMVSHEDRHPNRPVHGGSGSGSGGTSTQTLVCSQP